MLGPGAPIMAIIAGSSMIASGGISIFGTSLIDSKKHPTAAAALLISGSGIAVVGGALGAINGAFSGVDLFKNVLSKVIVAGLSVVSNGTEIMKQNYDIDLSKLKADSALSQKENESAKERNRSLEMESQSYNETISNLTDTCIALQIHHQSAIRKITALSGAIAG
jgi:FtsZ-binding cell division protein ZapB